MFEWHRADISDVSLEFGTDIKVGRINIDSKRKRSRNNDIFRVNNVDSGSIVRKNASEASLIMLAVTYIIAALIGFHAEALIAIPALSLAFVLSCYVRYFSDKRIYDAHSMLYPKAQIIENGKRISLISLDVEIGDLICFSQGDIIPADARLVLSENLYVAERFYNKLNKKVEYKRLMKNHEALCVDDNAAEIYENMVYAGSAVVSGRGRAIVTAIGSATRIGRTEQTISLSTENDQPSVLNSFSRFAKRISLAVLLALIPLSIILIYSSTLGNASVDQPGILYTFLIMLAAAVTSMNELVISPATAILSDTLFGRKQKIDNGITKLSAIERIASTDTLLILCQDALVDKRNFIRRIFLSDKEYRFDSLKSDELDSFSNSIALYASNRSNSPDQYERRAIKKFVSDRSRKQGTDVIPLPSFIRLDDISAVNYCEYFRTDGGSIWRFNDNSRKRLFDYYYRYLDIGLKIYAYVSLNEENQQPVFEGMIAIGEEFPYCDGSVFTDCIEYGITPVLVLESENDNSLKFALNCGIVDGMVDVVLASDLEERGMLLSDAPETTRVYIGFGREGTKEIVKLLIKKGRMILPIIKDLSDKSAILPLNVYSTHKEASFESVKYTSSLALRFADAENHRGGVSDALNNIWLSCFALLKLDVYKHYLTFATVYRLAGIIMSLLSHNKAKPMTALMILLSGLIADYVALLALSTSRGTPAPGRWDSKSPPTMLYAFAGVCVALISHITINVLISTSFITAANSQIFCFYTSLMTQFVTLGAFLLIINNRLRKFDFNYAYISVLSAFCIYLVSQNWLPDIIYTQLEALSYARVELQAIPFLLIAGALSSALMILINRFFTRSDNN